MSESKLGQLIGEGEKRDAIHIAIAPMIADRTLNAGDHIGLVPGTTDRATNGRGVRPIGIVDPFLMEEVRKGDRFYMFLYPYTITSLRHNWTHPAFEDENDISAPSTEIKGDPVASEKWLRDFLAYSGPDYDDLIAAAQSDTGEYVRPNDSYYGVRIDNDYVSSWGNDAHGNIPDEFWDHLEVVTGRRMKKRPTYFSCSC